MLKPDVQASERLNKALSLFGERVPSGGIDLCSARLGMKHFLGGFQKTSDRIEEGKKLANQCMQGWPLLPRVEAEEDRFQPAMQRDDMPTLAEAKKLQTKIDPLSFPRITAAKIWAAAMNMRLQKHRSEKSYPCSTGIPALIFVEPPKSPLDSLRLVLLMQNCAIFMANVRYPLTFACLSLSLREIRKLSRSAGYLVVVVPV